MARSRSIVAPVALLALAAVLGLRAAAPGAFVPQQPRGVEAAAAASVLLPAAAAHAISPEAFEMDSSITLAGTVEPLMMGIVMGTVPITIFGLMVAAWLQFKKGPTLGL